MIEISFKIRSFEHGGYALVDGQGDIIRAASTIDEILGHVDRATHEEFAPPAEDIAERFRPAMRLPDAPEAPAKRGLMNALRRAA